MFGLLINPITNALDMAEQTLMGEGPTREQVIQMIDDGMSIAAVATTFGVGIDVIEALTEDE